MESERSMSNVKFACFKPERQYEVPYPLKDIIWANQLLEDISSDIESTVRILLADEKYLKVVLGVLQMLMEILTILEATTHIKLPYLCWFKNTPSITCNLPVLHAIDLEPSLYWCGAESKLEVIFESTRYWRALQSGSIKPIRTSTFFIFASKHYLSSLILV